jgi:CheY-like chemotaxis protein
MFTDLQNEYGPMPSVCGGRILVAEDDRAMRKLIAGALRKEGHTVTEAASGREALTRLGDAIHQGGIRFYDVVISDVRMPGSTGMELLAGLRETNWSVPVILITAFGDAKTHRDARRLGAVAVLDKPFPLTALSWLVRQLLP